MKDKEKEKTLAIQIKKEKKELEVEKFLLAAKELTLFLKENRRRVVNLLGRDNLSKNEQILKLSLQNLSYELN